MSKISLILNILLVIILTFVLTFLFMYTPTTIVDNINNNNAEEINETKLNILLYEKLNDERSNVNLNRLDSREDIEQISKYKTGRMMHEDYISHTTPDGEDIRDRFDRFGVQCAIVGENLAKTFYDGPLSTNYGDNINHQSMDELAEGITKQFMNSPEHKDNLLDENWESHGVNAQVTSENEVYATHKFCKE